MTTTLDNKTETDVYGGFDAMPIGGTWRMGHSGSTKVDTDPWSGETLLEIQLADVRDVDEAFSAAADSQVAWAKTIPAERAAIMRKAAGILEERKSELVAWLIHEAGSTVFKAELELAVVKAAFYEAAGMAHHMEGRILPSDIEGKENRVYRTPVGVVAIISPWNFPTYLTSRSLGPALALGNSVVLKPAGDTPVTGGLILAKVLEEAGLPPGILNVVVGSGSNIGDAIVGHPVPRVVSFTGSTAVGEGIPGKAGVKRLCLELGGNGPIVVLEDADLQYAVEAAVFGSYFHSGQVCMIANRIIAVEAVHDEFVDRFVERVKSLKVGDPSEPSTFIGPVISKKQLASVQGKVKRAREQGAELLVGGKPVGPAGLSLPPHVLVGSNEVATAKEEVFGPVMTIIQAQDEGDALALANDTDYGLSSAVFTKDGERGVRFALQVEAGMTHVNDSPVNSEDNTAFGGEKRSGIGRFGGTWAGGEFTTDHWISVQYQPRRFPI
jgi:aldehyde dehydrogenase (NAD+)